MVLSVKILIRAIAIMLKVVQKHSVMLLVNKMHLKHTLIINNRSFLKQTANL